MATVEFGQKFAVLIGIFGVKIIAMFDHPTNKILPL